MAIFPLDGAWQFRIAGEPTADAPAGAKALTRWQPGSVPGTVHHHLHALGKIPDPHYARNELDLQWIDAQNWEWRRSFDVNDDALATSRQELVFDGIDTVATILLNGKEVGRSANMFRQVVCNVRGVLRAGRNELTVVIASPTAYAKAQAEKGKHRVADGDWRWQTGEIRLTHRAWIRKVQCHFGWDWGLYLATSGIWQSCRLECASGPRVATVTVAQHHVGPVGAPGHVTLDVAVHLVSPARAKGFLTLSLHDGSDQGARPVVLAAKQLSSAVRAGETVVNVQLQVRNPELWWPAGEGGQPLYVLSAWWSTPDEKTQSAIRRTIGLRTVELVRDADTSPDGKPAESFYFRVNGRPIFAKGANWIPPDQFVDRCTPDVYRHLLQSMVEANMNVVRVWGGGWYEQDVFYELCDRLGLMVWQDFMMACALYPDTKDFIDELTAEARHQMRRLHAHPSIVLWCGDNENAEAVWGWWGASPDLKKHVEIYGKVMTALRQTVEGEDPTRAFWLSSPSNDVFAPNNGDPNRGDVHYWTVWHGKQPFSNYLTVKPRFASEFGFQSFPEPRTIRACVPAEELNPSSRVMEHHQRSPDGNMLITNTMAREMRIPRDFDTFCWVSQINQAMAIRTAVEHWRRLRPWCMGAIYWQVNDLWPVASWSSIDYHGRWKVLHHYAKRFFEPLLATIVHEGDRVSVWATSDLASDQALTGEISAVTWDGRRVGRETVSGRLKAGESRPLATVDVAKLLKGKAEPHEVCLFVRLRGGQGVSAENFATLVPWKWVTLPEPNLHLEWGEGVELRVSSDQVVPFFHAELEGLEGHFEGDWQVMRPGVDHVMRWVPHVHLGAKAPSMAEAKRRLKTMSLYDTYEHFNER